MILGTIAFFIYVYLSIGLNKFITAIESLDLSNFLPFYVGSFALTLSVMLLWVASWVYLLRVLSVELGFRKAFQYYIAGDFVDRLVPSPGIVGEVTRALLVRREICSSYGTIAAAGITNRIISYGVVTGAIGVGIAFLIVTGTVPVIASGLLLAVWIGALTLFLLLSFVSLREDAAKKIARMVIKLLNIVGFKRNIEKLAERVFGFLSQFHEGFKYFGANPKYLMAPIILNIASFVLNLAVYVLVFYALGLQFPIDFFVVVYFLAGAIQDGAAAFSVGGLEILLTNIFIFYGVQPAAAGLTAVVLRSVTFYFPLIFGYVLLQLIGVKNVWNSRNAKPIEDGS